MTSSDPKVDVTVQPVRLTSDRLHLFDSAFEEAGGDLGCVEMEANDLLLSHKFATRHGLRYATEAFDKLHTLAKLPDGLGRRQVNRILAHTNKPKLGLAILDLINTFISVNVVRRVNAAINQKTGLIVDLSKMSKADSMSERYSMLLQSLPQNWQLSEIAIYSNTVFFRCVDRSGATGYTDSLTGSQSIAYPCSNVCMHRCSNMGHVRNNYIYFSGSDHYIGLKNSRKIFRLYPEGSSFSPTQSEQIRAVIAAYDEIACDLSLEKIKLPVLKNLAGAFLVDHTVYEKVLSDAFILAKASNSPGIRKGHFCAMFGAHHRDRSSKVRFYVEQFCGVMVKRKVW